MSTKGRQSFDTGRTYWKDKPFYLSHRSPLPTLSFFFQTYLAAPMDNEGLDRDVFGPLVDIPERSLVTVATKISQQALGHPQSSGKVIATLGGSHNIVHVVELECSVKIVIRVPATG
jgi:hypothetical protein